MSISQEPALSQNEQFPDEVVLAITQYSFPFFRELHYALGLIEDPGFRENVESYEMAIYQEITRQITTFLTADFKIFVLNLKIKFSALHGYPYFEHREEIKSLILAATKEYSIGLWSELYRKGFLTLPGYEFYLNHVDRYLLTLRTLRS